jgi:hypothetical protein
MDGQLNMPEVYSKLKSKHFPLFTTIQKLIFMLDGTLRNSYFTRDSDGRILGMDSHLGWHSECSNGSGVMMINTHHKSSSNFDE